MQSVLRRSLVVGLLSVLASLAISFSLVPVLGGQVAGAGLIMTILCPLLISIPASAIHFHQADRLRRSEAATADALNRLAVAYEELHNQSRRDALTGVLTRKAFFDELDLMSLRGVSGGLFFLDLDHFKSINDRHGHASGDEVLRSTGRALRRYEGEAGFVGRMGGEEFAIFQMNLTVDNMAQHSENIRADIERLRLRSPSGPVINLSASIGGFYCPPHFHPELSLAAADRNLYQAKAQGRNKVVVSA